MSKRKILCTVFLVLWAIAFATWGVSLLWPGFGSYTWCVVAGIAAYLLFVVILQWKYIREYFQKQNRGRQNFRFDFKHCPKWMRVIGYGSMILGLASFLLYILLLFDGYLEVAEGTYWIAKDGELVKELTKGQYDRLLCLGNCLPASFAMMTATVPLAQYAKRRHRKHRSSRKSEEATASQAPSGEASEAEASSGEHSAAQAEPAAETAPVVTPEMISQAMQETN